MNRPLGRPYRLAERGGAGLVCDKDGVALGSAALVRIEPGGSILRRCAVEPPWRIRQILEAAYGCQPDEVIERVSRGLQRVAAAIDADDLSRASIEAVMLGLPDLTAAAISKLAAIADLSKGGDAWKDEPRIPPGQAGGGQWTTGASLLSSDSGGVPRPNPPRPPAPHLLVPHRVASINGTPSQRLGADGSPTLILDDGVYRPGEDDPFWIPASDLENNEPRFGSNGPPEEEYTSLTQVFPGLETEPGVAIPLASVDSFLDISSSANEANLEVSLSQYRTLFSQLKAVKPGFANDQLFPAGGFAGLSWSARNTVIRYMQTELSGFRMQKAEDFYKNRGDDGPLQVETLRFLQSSVDESYSEAEAAYREGKLKPAPSREIAIGKFIDRHVRDALRDLYRQYKIPYGPREDITINNRDYDNSSEPATYRVPDARIGRISFDWTLSIKTSSSPQLRGFFRADSRPVGVVIVRPSQLGPGSTFMISRPRN